MSSTDRKPFSVSALRTLSLRCANALEYVSLKTNTNIGGRIDTALAVCEKGERQHRAMGARFTSGQASYRLPVLVSARLMMGRSFFVQAPNYICSMPSDLAGMREDHLNMVLAHAELRAYVARYNTATWTQAIELLAGYGDLKSPDGKWLTSLEMLGEYDYSLDCAVR